MRSSAGISFAAIASLLLASCAAGEVTNDDVLLTREVTRGVFAGNDCCGRLRHSEVRLVGAVESGDRLLSIYDLWYVNPETRHGMRHVAVTEGGRFVGAYIISPSARPTIAGDRLEFVCADQSICSQSMGEDLTFRNGALPPTLWVDGEVNEMDDTI